MVNVCTLILSITFCKTEQMLHQIRSSAPSKQSFLSWFLMNTGVEGIYHFLKPECDILLDVF